MESYDDNSTTSENTSAFTRRLEQIGRTDLKFLVPSPSAGSPCKRLNLFLRWMVRRDGIDFGLWKDVSPSRLIMPLDTHIARVALQLGWIRTPSLTWSKAERITEALRRFDAEDPIRYDFSLCHESMRRSETLRRLRGIVRKTAQ